MSRAAAAVLLIGLLMGAGGARADDEERWIEGPYRRLEQVGERRLLVLQGAPSLLVPDEVYAAGAPLFLTLTPGEPLRVRARAGVALEVARGERPADPDAPPDPGWEPLPLEDPELAPDFFALRQVAVGDTLRIGRLSGRLEALAAERYRLRVWEAGAWGRVVEGARGEVTATALRRVSLVSRVRVSAEGAASVHLELERRRSEARGGLTTSLRLRHDHPDGVLLGVGVGLRIQAGGAGGGEQAQRRDLELPPLLADEEHEVTGLAPADALDVGLDLVEPRLVDLAAPEARPALLSLLDAGRPPERRRRLYGAAARADQELGRFVLGVVAAGPREERELAREALADAGPRFLDLLAVELGRSDAGHRLTLLVEGALTEAAPPDGWSPRAYRELLVELLTAVPRPWEPAHREALFEAYRERPLLRPAIEAAFALRPADAVACLLEPALAAAGSEADAPGRERAHWAAVLLERLGDAVRAPLSRALAGRGPAAPPDADARQLLALAREASRRAARERARVARGALAARAREHLRAGRPAEALADLRRLRAAEPDHAASRLVPTALLELAAARLAAGDERSEVAALLEEARREAADAGLDRRAGALLGRLCLEAVEEERAAGVVVRSRPHPLARSLGPLRPDVGHAARAAGEGWTEVELEGGGGGFVRSACLVADPAGQLRRGAPLDAPVLLALIEQARALAPELAEAADAVRRDVLLGAARRAYAAGDLRGAVSALERARQLGADPGWLAWACWLRLHAFTLVGAGLALGALGVLARLAGRAWREERAERLVVPGD